MPGRWPQASLGKVQENVYHTGWKVLVLVCSDCYKKTSQAECLTNDRNVFLIFLIVLEVGSQRSGASISPSFAY